MSTKEKLFLAAKEIFSEKGFYETKVSDIVEKAGVAQGTFYIYFKSKEDIFIKLVKKLHSDLMKKLKIYSEVNIDFSDKIKNFSKDFATEVYKNKDIANIFFTQLSGSNEEFRKLFIQKISDLQNLLIEIIEKNIQNQDASLIADLIIGFHRQIFLNCIFIKNLTLEEVLEKVEKGIDIIIKGIYEVEELSEK